MADTNQKYGGSPLPRLRCRLVVSPLAVALTLLASILLAGCNEDQGGLGGSTLVTGSTTTTEITGQIVSVHFGETATILDGIRITAYAPEVDPQTAPVYHGNVVLYCVIELANDGDGDFDYDQAFFSLHADNETWTGGHPGLATAIEPPLLSGTLKPGQSVRGAVTFEFSPEEVARAGHLSLYVPAARPVTLSIYWYADDWYAD